MQALLGARANLLRLVTVAVTLVLDTNVVDVGGASVLCMSASREYNDRPEGPTVIVAVSP